MSTFAPNAGAENDAKPVRNQQFFVILGGRLLAILSVPSWHTSSERRRSTATPIPNDALQRGFPLSEFFLCQVGTLPHSAQSASVPPPFTSATTSVPLSWVYLLPVIWGRTPKPQGSDRLNLSFGSSNPRCTPPIVCSNLLGARAVL